MHLLHNEALPVENREVLGLSNKQKNPSEKKEVSLLFHGSFKVSAAGLSGSGFFMPIPKGCNL